MEFSLILSLANWIADELVDKEFFSKKEAVQFFNLEGVGKSPAKFDQKKLDNINSYYFKKLSFKDLHNIISNIYSIKSYTNDFLEKLLLTFQSRSENVEEFPTCSKLF